MKIQKLSSGKDLYYSCDLLDQGQGVEGFTNVKTIKVEYESTAKEVSNNIVYIESKDEYKLEEFNKTKSTPIIIEKDMFGKQKIWIKEGAYCDLIFDKLKTSKIISLSELEDVITDSLKSYYKDNKLNISILNGLSNSQRKEAYKEIKPDEMIDNFVLLASKESLKFNIEDGKCIVSLNENELSRIKVGMKNNALDIIKVKDLLRTKASSLNDLIQDHKPHSKKPKNKI